MKRIVTYLGIICLVIYYQRKSAAHPSLLERGNHDNERNKHSWISNRTIQGPDSRNKRKADPGPRTDPQLILPNDNPGIPLLNSDAALSLIPRREFAPTRGILRQREFIPGGLLPTPRIIKPLDLGPSPLDLERRPFIGQGIVPIAPEFHRHLPLLEEPRHLLPSFARPRHLLTPFAGPRHILPPLAEQSHLLTPLAEQGTLLSPLVEQRHLLPPLAEQRHLLPPLEEPRHLFEEQRHYFPNEGASRLYHSLDEPKRLFSSEIGELRRHPEFLPQAVEPSHRDLIRPDGLQRHSFYHKHHNYPSVGSLGDITLPFGSIGDEKPDSDLYKHENDHPDVDAFNGSPGQENELSELKDLLSALGGRKKTKKTWVTDVNVYDKKRKLDDLASLFGADDDTDDGFGKCRYAFLSQLILLKENKCRYAFLSQLILLKEDTTDPLKIICLFHNICSPN